MRFIILLVLLVPLLVHAKTYKCVDAAGGTVYQTTPCAVDVSQKEMHLPGAGNSAVDANANEDFEHKWEGFKARIPAMIKAYCAKMKPDNSRIYKECPNTYRSDLNYMYTWARKLYGKPRKQAVFTKYVNICRQEMNRSVLFADDWGWVSTCMLNWPHVSNLKKEMKAAGDSKN